ncbi:MAG: hypothetical protein A2X49_08205 [Lentisphaerae bacterium GWF2_52_8]|nr:MAG: hypothetical protein A2X49_08205 [Lentisphaerae bacterium GWF2_52_8]
MKQRIRLGVSACLMGKTVRYDGQSKFDPSLVTELSRFAELLPLCPETEAGLSVPRPPMRLVGAADAPHLIVIENGEDMTAELEAWIEEKCSWLLREGICGLVLKSKSPSCGPSHVEVFEKDGTSAGWGLGLFAAACKRSFPLMPMADEKEIGTAIGIWDFEKSLRAYCEQLPATM